MKIKKVLMGVALAAMCLMSAQAQRRNEIQVPNLNGYTTLNKGEETMRVKVWSV